MLKESNYFEDDWMPNCVGDEYDNIDVVCIGDFVYGDDDDCGIVLYDPVDPKGDTVSDTNKRTTTRFIALLLLEIIIANCPFTHFHIFTLWTTNRQKHLAIVS